MILRQAQDTFATGRAERPKQYNVNQGSVKQRENTVITVFNQSLEIYHGRKIRTSDIF